MSIFALAFIIAMTTITLSPAIVAVLGGTVSPWLVAFVAHLDAPKWVKQLLGGLVAVAIGLVVDGTLADGSSVIELRTVVFAVLTFLVQQVSYLHLWARLGLNKWKWLLPAFGIGKPKNK